MGSPPGGGGGKGQRASNSPTRIHGLPCRALPQLLERRGPIVAQVVRRRRRDDAVPDHGLVGGIFPVLGRPLGRDVDENLLGIPGEEGRQVRVEAELYDGILLLLGAVVVGAALDDLQVGGLEEARGVARGEQVGGGDEGGDDKGHGREEAEGILDAHDGAVHRGRYCGVIEVWGEWLLPTGHG